MCNVYETMINSNNRSNDTRSLFGSSSTSSLISTINNGQMISGNNYDLITASSLTLPTAPNITLNNHKNSSNSATISTNNHNKTSSRALQQYQQSPFAIQQLLGLSKNDPVVSKNKLCSPTNSTISSSIHTDIDDELNEFKLINGDISRASSNGSASSINTNSSSSRSSSVNSNNSSISVGSHGTISLPKLNSFSVSTTLPSINIPNSSSLSVTNLVNANVSSNFSSVYFPTTRHGSLSQSILHPSVSAPPPPPSGPPSSQASEVPPPPSSGSSSSVAAAAAAAAVAAAECFANANESGTRIQYFNSPAAAAFMSVASVHVGLQQHANTIANSSFAGPNNAISIFNPFDNTNDVNKFTDKNTATNGKFFFFFNLIYSKLFQK